MDGCRAYFNVQLITICAVAKSKCSVLNVQFCCIVNGSIACFVQL